MSKPVRTPYTVCRAYLEGFRLSSRRDPSNVYARLRDLHLIRFTLERMERELVAGLRADGATWFEVGQALQVSESAARHRYGGQ